MTGHRPGLDPAELQGIRHARRDHQHLLGRIRGHLDQHEGYVAFSGGKDSEVALHLTLQVAPRVPVVFFDSGLEFPETYQFLERLGGRLGFDLHVVRPQAGVLEHLIRSGAWDHRAPAGPRTALQEQLVTQPAAEAHRRFGPGEIWGVRAQESRGRAAAYANALRAATCGCDPECAGTERRRRHGGVIDRVDGTTAFGPVWDWKTPDVWGYLQAHRLPVNPVYAKLRQLGAPESMLRVSSMIDGNRLEDGRALWLRRGWPDLFEELATLLPRLREWV